MTPEEAIGVIERQMLAARLAWAEAMLLAGRGRDAVPMLVGLGDLPAAIDLRARISLRAGHPAAAARLWQALLAADPGSVLAIDGLQRLSRRKRWAVPLAAGLLVATILLAARRVSRA